MCDRCKVKWRTFDYVPKLRAWKNRADRARIETSRLQIQRGKLTSLKIIEIKYLRSWRHDARFRERLSASDRGLMHEDVTKLRRWLLQRRLYSVRGIVDMGVIYTSLRRLTMFVVANGIGDRDYGRQDLISVA